MGVPEVWELLKPNIKDKRISFKRFVTEFKNEHNSAPRIAIDGHNWLFECGFFHNDSRQRNGVSNDNPDLGLDDIENGKPFINFISKIRDFLVLDVTFVIVFDGPLKPHYKGKGNVPLRDIVTEGTSAEELLKNYCDSYHLHEQLHQKRCGKKYDPILRHIQEILDALGITYIMACAEGESQCAWLQREGIVDYVMSNDSDSFMFGATKILRNYSKNIEDRSPSSAYRSSDNTNENEYYITVVDLDEINQSSNITLDSKRLLFFSILMGGDYNVGLSGLGKTKALVLMKWKDPDFVEEFFSIFTSMDQVADAVVNSYSEFQNKLFQYCKENGKTMFGRNYKLLLSRENYKGWPLPHLIYHYRFPIINTEISAEILDPSKAVNVEGSKRYRTVDLKQVKRILDLRGVPSLCKFDSWFHRTMHEFFLVKQVSLFPEETVNNNYAKITDEKAELDKCGMVPLSYVKIRYRTFLQGTESSTLTQEMPDSPEKIDQELSSPRKASQRQIDIKEYPYVIWIPKLLIPANNVLITRFEAERSKAITPLRRESSSPKKRKSIYSQNNTLDGFLSKHSSPARLSPAKLSPAKFSPTTENDTVLHKEKTRRKLFIEDAEEEEEEEEDSLIIVEERRVRRDIEYLIATSPVKRRKS
ncbi:Holliday junction resolvase YEN1 [Nakaseomyces bracarensis]|uniref:Holliday junction resolvase YEN1 n=1 Tax=Nakaseomyces bracarensis TaxID=273131 RepID=A0ABR4NSL8_9SACH